MSNGISSPRRIERRAFLKGAGAATVTALTVGFEWAGSTPRAQALATAANGAPFAPNAFVRIGTDNSITIIAKHIEMGQGSYTGLATILADELDADWAQVRVESAPADATRYANLVFGKIQGTGGSSSIANSWPQLRDAGAKARAMLLTAASNEWHVPVGDLTVPPNSGARFSSATSMPGISTSIVNSAVPSHFAATSTRGTRLPMSLKSFGSLSCTVSGTGRAAAFFTSEPKVA